MKVLKSCIFCCPYVLSTYLWRLNFKNFSNNIEKFKCVSSYLRVNFNIFSKHREFDGQFNCTSSYLKKLNFKLSPTMVNNLNVFIAIWDKKSSIFLQPWCKIWMHLRRCVLLMEYGTMFHKIIIGTQPYYCQRDDIISHTIFFSVFSLDDDISFEVDLWIISFFRTPC